MKGFNVLLKIGDKIIGGQKSATLRREASTVEVTNQITMEWKSYLTNNLSWSVDCNGLYFLNDEGLAALEEAYLSNTAIQLELSNDVVSYSGEGLLISFPLGADYNDTATYNLKIKGNGALIRV